MWANAQCDGCPAEYRWRPLFNAAKFGWRPLLEWRAVTLPRRETCWNVLGCPKLDNQPLVGRRSPHSEDMCGRHCCLTSFLRLSIRALVASIAYSSTKLCDGAKMANFWRFFSVLHFQQAACSTFQTCIAKIGVFRGLITPKPYVAHPKSRTKGTSLGCQLDPGMIPIAQDCAVRVVRRA